ncbi:MAG: GTP-binding protein [Candidatus Heimdallarchaeota archaeon]|nr:GTP-binding protein [Candidatus Heimdallarchaeota archaeon]
MSRKPIGWLRKGKSVVIMGLDYAGKSTLVNQWTKGVMEKTVTTIGLDIEHVEIQGETFNLIDLGGQQPFRLTIWKTYAQMAQGIIFVFDITDKRRVEEAVEWFWKVIEWLREDAPIVFCANKIDLRDEKKKTAMSLEEIINTFQLDKLSQEEFNQHSFRIFEISAKTGENVQEAMQWIFGRVIGSDEKSKIKAVQIYSIEKNNSILELPFSEEFNEMRYDESLIEIIDYNIKLYNKSQSTMQYYEQNKYDVYIFAQKGYLCLIVTDKDAEYNSIRITSQSILSVVDVLEQEGNLTPEFLKWVIKESFGA